MSVDLRQPVNESAAAKLRYVKLERSFGIVSAQDPMGVTQPQAVNDELGARLQAEVATLNVLSTNLDACSPDRSHCEFSVAIVADLETVVGIARRYGQLAIFWFDGDAFWIIPACSDKARLRLPARD